MALAQSLRARESIARVNVQLEKLLDTPNPKLEWILQQDWKGEAAVFTPMAMGKSCGSHLIGEQEMLHLGVIHSINELRSGNYSTLVLPGTMQYLSLALAMRLLHQGEFGKIHVLLHEGEPLSLKNDLSYLVHLFFQSFHRGAAWRLSIPELKTGLRRLLVARQGGGPHP